MKKIEPIGLWEALPGRILLDVRTPSEYTDGHIPGAINLPLFSDEERAIVGTLYKQHSPQQAFLKGLEFAGAKMPWYVQEALKLSEEKRVVIHCWRGGQRSGSLAWLLDSAGFEVSVLSGGYKHYRSHVLSTFAERKLRLVVLGGPTGSGKTAVLQALRAAGEQVIDLEGIARHKGSSFGALGEAPQPTVEQFENDLYEVFRSIDPRRRVWVENESRTIGRVCIPEGFWQQFRQAPLIEIHPPFERRVAYLVEGYGRFPKEGLRDAFLRLEKRLRGQYCKAALEALAQDDLASAAAIALRYYDRSYAHSNSKCSFQPVIRQQVDLPGDPHIALQLIEQTKIYGI